MIYVGVTSNKSVLISELQRSTNQETIALVSILSAKIPNQNVGCKKIQLKKQDIISVIVDYSADDTVFPEVDVVCPVLLVFVAR